MVNLDSLPLSKEKKIAISQDSLIDSALIDFKLLQLQKNAPNSLVEVYRIQALNTNDRIELLSTKKDLEFAFPKTPILVLFREPYYKLKIGLFENLFKAEQFRQDLDNFFYHKKAIVIIPEMILLKDFWETFYPHKKPFN